MARPLATAIIICIGPYIDPLPGYFEVFNTALAPPIIFIKELLPDCLGIAYEKSHIVLIGHASDLTMGDKRLTFTGEQLATLLINKCGLTRRIEKIDIIGCEVGLIDDRGRSFGKDFLRTMIRLGCEELVIRVISPGVPSLRSVVAGRCQSLDAKSALQYIPDTPANRQSLKFLDDLIKEVKEEIRKNSSLIRLIALTLETDVKNLESEAGIKAAIQAAEKRAEPAILDPDHPFKLDDFIEILSAHRKPGQGHSQVILELLDKKKQLEAQLADCNKRIEQMFVPRAVADNIFSLLDVSSTVYYARQESRWDKIKETGPYLKIAMAVFKLQMAARWL